MNIAKMLLIWGGICLSLISVGSGINTGPRVIMLVIGLLTFGIGIGTIFWDRAVRHFHEAQTQMGENYATLSEGYERLGQRMAGSDEMKSGINIGQDSILTEYERFTASLRENVDSRLNSNSPSNSSTDESPAAQP